MYAGQGKGQGQQAKNGVVKKSYFLGSWVGCFFYYLLFLFLFFYSFIHSNDDKRVESGKKGIASWMDWMDHGYGGRLEKGGNGKGKGVCRFLVCLSFWETVFSNGVFLLSWFGLGGIFFFFFFL